MTPQLVNYLCDPNTGEPLALHAAEYAPNGDIVSGTLVSTSNTYPIVNGIPRFFVPENVTASVQSFGEEWNHFNFVAFKEHWLRHTVANTFGSLEPLRGKLIVDAGGGSGAQTLWMLEAGARHVIMLELSDSVDDVVRRNLASSGFSNFDVVQCSIDRPPLRKQCIDGIVYCHNVIQHTPSVENTARALFATVAPGGEFVFNVYPANTQGVLRWLRFHLLYRPLRGALSRMPFPVILGYARAMAVAREVPLMGALLEKAGFLVQGDVPEVAGESGSAHLRRRMRATTLNTYDWFGFHAYQHHKTEEEVRALVRELQPDESKVLNLDSYFRRPPLHGCALRVFR